MEEKFTKEEIKLELVKVYLDAFAEYATLDRLATEMLNKGEKTASAAVRRYAYSQCSFLDGLKTAADAFGIDDAEFMEAVSTYKRNLSNIQKNRA